MEHPIFVQIITGKYSYYSERFKNHMESHCLYGLTEKGDVWKYVVGLNKWKPLEELSTVPEYRNELDDF